MNLECGLFEFEITGTEGHYAIDPITDEETELLHKVVRCVISLKSDYLDFTTGDILLINTDEYQLLIDELTDIITKPDFRRITISPILQILGVPGTLKDDDELDDFTDVFNDELNLDFDIAPSMMMVIGLPCREGIGSSTLQIRMDEDEIKMLIDYLKSKQDSIDEISVIS